MERNLMDIEMYFAEQAIYWLGIVVAFGLVLVIGGAVVDRFFNDE